MNFFKLIFLALLLMLATKVSMADSHDVEQNIIDKAKEINQNIKKKQSNQQANISSETVSYTHLTLPTIRSV